MSKSKYLIVLVACLSMTGCGWFSKVTAVTTGYSITCIKETNVKYVQFSSGSAPLYDKDGKLVPCN